MTNEQERAAFFAWVADCGCDTDGAWSAWQARAALASQAWQEPVARMLTVAETDSIAEEMEDWLRFDVVEAVIRKFCDVNAIPLAAPLAAGEPHTEVVPASSVQRLMGDLQKRSDECEGVLIHIHRDELRKLLAAASGVKGPDHG